MNTLDRSLLGKPTAYVCQYQPSLLFPLPRLEQRQHLGLNSVLPFMGADLWTSYELSWLNPRGKPQVALVRFVVPIESPCIVESKSVKLYLNSFSQSVFESAQSVQEAISRDIAQAIWSSAASVSPSEALAANSPSQNVSVTLLGPDEFDAESIEPLQGLSLDRLDVECTHYQPTASLLKTQASEHVVTQTLKSDLLKSNCLVTGQPDWGSVQITYTGREIHEEGLLQYLVSFRDHNEFHEHCVERIFMDIWNHCRPLKLSVYARYTRRGGVEINPFRTSFPQAMPKLNRTARQ
jgi:7-cyano-7-deazaguanine reductase